MTVSPCSLLRLDDPQRIGCERSGCSCQKASKHGLPDRELTPIGGSSRIRRHLVEVVVGRVGDSD